MEVSKVIKLGYPINEAIINEAETKVSDNTYKVLSEITQDIKKYQDKINNGDNSYEGYLKVHEQIKKDVETNFPSNLGCSSNDLALVSSSFNDKNMSTFLCFEHVKKLFKEIGKCKSASRVLKGVAEIYEVNGIKFICKAYKSGYCTRIVYYANKKELDKLVGSLQLK